MRARILLAALFAVPQVASAQAPPTGPIPAAGAVAPAAQPPPPQYESRLEISYAPVR